MPFGTEHVGVKPYVLLDALKAHLTEHLRDATRDSVIVATNPDDEHQGPGDVQFTLTPGGFTFLQQAFDGGARETFRTEWMVELTVRLFAQVDDPDRDEHVIRETLILADSVLTALAGWNPRNSDGYMLLAEPCWPMQGSAATRMRRENGDIGLQLRLVFDWLLGPQPETDPA